MKTFTLYSNGKKVAERVLLDRLIAEGPGTQDFFRLGIFESMRTYDKKLFRPGEHIQRFRESARTAGAAAAAWPVSKINGELSRALKAYYRENPDAGDVFVRLTAWGEEIFVFIGRRTHPPHLYEQGVRLQTSPVKRTLARAEPPEVKTSQYMNAVWGALEVTGGAVYERLFLDPQGFVTEVSIGNFFIVRYGSGFGKQIRGKRVSTCRGAEILTPARGILHGVTRRFVIESAHQMGASVRETLLTRHDVYNADEAFLTNTSWEVLPVSELDCRRVGKAVPGPVTKALQRCFPKTREKHNDRGKIRKKGTAGSYQRLR